MGVLKSVLSNRGLVINAKCICEGSNCTNGVLRSRAIAYMRSAERRKVNVLEVKCLRNFL